MKPWAMALLLLLLIGCSGRPAQVGGSGQPQPSQAPAGATNTGEKPGDTLPQTANITLTQAPDGSYRLEASSGSLGAMAWIGSDRFTFDWFPPGMNAGTIYVADLASKQVHRLGEGDPLRAFVHPTGSTAVVVTGRPASLLRIEAVQIETGARETILAMDDSQPQWATGPDTEWVFGATVDVAVDAQWVDQQTLVLTLTPQDQRNIQTWGKVLRIDLEHRQVSVLTPGGRALALPCDGELAEAELVQSGWVDGPLTVVLPDGASEGAKLAPAGLWKWALTGGQGEPVVAWLELDPPPGDWSARLPHACCSGDPHPKVRSVVLWHRAGGKVIRIPAPAALPWEPLFVLRDGSVLYAAAPDPNGTKTEIYRVDLAGHQTRLAVHDWRGRFTLLAEGPDGSLYYTLTGRLGQNPSTLVRRHPDGQTDRLWEGLLEAPMATTDRLFLSEFGAANLVIDLATGKSSPGPSGRPSPDGTWVLSGGLPDQPRAIQVSPFQP